MEVSVVDFIAENKNQTNRLRALTDIITRNWKTDVGAGWTVGTMLCHVAFWDKVRKVSIDRWIESGELPPNLEIENVHRLNESLRAMSETIPAEAGLHFALACAEEIDRQVESLQPVQIQELENSGRERWFRRHLHRKAHLDRIESALSA
jgi:hypothetical protein